MIRSKDNAVKIQVTCVRINRVLFGGGVGGVGGGLLQLGTRDSAGSFVRDMIIKS